MRHFLRHIFRQIVLNLLNADRFKTRFFQNLRQNAAPLAGFKEKKYGVFQVVLRFLKALSLRSYVERGAGCQPVFPLRGEAHFKRSHFNHDQFLFSICKPDATGNQGQEQLANGNPHSLRKPRGHCHGQCRAGRALSLGFGLYEARGASQS